MKYWKQQDQILVVLDRGEPLVTNLTRCLTDLGICGGTISGLGAIAHVELGYYVLPKKEYIKKTFLGEYELLSLSGNITLKDGKPFAHVHTVISDESFQPYGGHLFEAEVAVTAEISILPFHAQSERQWVEDIGLQLIRNCKI